MVMAMRCQRQAPFFMPCLSSQLRSPPFLSTSLHVFSCRFAGSNSSTSNQGRRNSEKTCNTHRHMSDCECLSVTYHDDEQLTEISNDLCLSLCLSYCFHTRLHIQDLSTHVLSCVLSFFPPFFYPTKEVHPRKCQNLFPFCDTHRRAQTHTDTHVNPNVTTKNPGALRISISW